MHNSLWSEIHFLPERVILTKLIYLYLHIFLIGRTNSLRNLKSLPSLFFL
jgi:hypothetical protein